MYDDEFRDGFGRCHGASVSKRDFLFLVTGSVATVGVASVVWPFHRPDESGRRHHRGGRPGRHRHHPASAGPAGGDLVGRPAGLCRQASPAGARRTERTPSSSTSCATRIRRNCSSRAYAANWSRSIKPEILVLVGVCTHLGCIPLFEPTPDATNPAPDWPGRLLHARATARNTISPAGCPGVCPRPTICRCRPIISLTTRRCASAKTPSGANFDFNSIIQV